MHLIILIECSQLYIGKKLNPLQTIAKDTDMIHNRNGNPEVGSYFLVRNSIPDMPMRLKIHFDALQSSLWNSQTHSSKNKSIQTFFLAFNKLSLHEKAHLMNENISYLAKQLEQRSSSKSLIPLFQPPDCNEIETVETTAYLSSTKMKIPVWATVKFKLDKLRGQVHMNSSKKNIICSLRSYLVRKSKKDQKIVVFNAICSDLKSQSYRKLSVSFTNRSAADSVYEQLVKLMIRYRNQEIFFMIDFLKGVDQTIQRKVTEEEMKPFRIENNQEVVVDQFQTVLGEELDHDQVVVTGEAGDVLSDHIAQIEIGNHIEKGCLKKKFKLQPMQGYHIKENLMTEHYLFQEWQRNKDGGVVCINQEIINEQKKVLKHVLTSFGNKLLYGGNIMNIGFPVKVFKKQSHLYSIAKNLSFAPLFFEGLHNPLERVKFATLLAISAGTLGISMEKPFNPILGETTQLWIGGCPMYLEQISHYPPICAYFFKGRGFKLYGQVELKVKFGMKSLKGYSERPNYIEFDDGTRIEIVFGKMLIYGLLFGERLFNFDEKIYAYDTTNHIFSEANYGPRRKNMIMKNSEPMDFCHGRVYKLKPEFVPRFQSGFPRAYPTKQHIVKELSKFQGIWTGSIKFDGKEYIDFKTQLPCALNYENNPLPSDSTLRKDLSKLIEGEISEAQTEKQILEEIQRRDQQLRKKAKEEQLTRAPS